LKRNGAALCEILKVIACPARHPVLVHCSHGKDRTGLVCALVLSVAGASDEEILADYALSRDAGGYQLAYDEFTQVRACACACGSA
jgi:protein tyrosine/serine phosphatase